MDLGIIGFVIPIIKHMVLIYVLLVYQAVVRCHTIVVKKLGHGQEDLQDLSPYHQ